MGTFRVQIEVGDPAGGRFQTLDALVDTGATYTWVPRDVLERLGIRPEEERPFLLADGRQVMYSIAWVRIDGRSQPTITVLGVPGPIRCSACSPWRASVWPPIRSTAASCRCRGFSSSQDRFPRRPL